MQLGIPTFPNYRSYFYYDDKIVQHYLFENKLIPTPKTNVFFSEDDALTFLTNATFPLIYKSAHGAGSSNVGLFEKQSQAEKYVKNVFSKGVKTFFKSEIQRDYVYFQQFIPDVKGDYRLVCFGDGKVTGFYRENEDGEIFASGAGKNIAVELPQDLLEFVCDIHEKLGKEIVMSYDILKNENEEWLVTEMSVLFGDLNSIVYTDSKYYVRDDSGKYVLVENQKFDRHKYFIDLLIKSWDWSE